MESILFPRLYIEAQFHFNGFLSLVSRDFVFTTKKSIKRILKKITHDKSKGNLVSLKICLTACLRMLREKGEKKLNLSDSCYFPLLCFWGKMWDNLSLYKVYVFSDCYVFLVPRTMKFPDPDLSVFLWIFFTGPFFSN